MPRTTAASVRLQLKRDYDAGRQPSLEPDIETANLVTTRVVACAAAKGVTVSAEEAAVIERWLACYFYTQSDGTYSSVSDIRGSGSVNKTAESYLNGAKMVDPSGCVAELMSKKPYLFWAGKRPSEQTDYVDRD